MEAGKNVYEVQVAGLPLKLRSSHDQSTVNELIGFVDQKVKEVMGAAPSISFQNALLLAALNIAEDLVLLKRVARQELGALETQAERILEQIEEAQSN
ncbi:MAG: cell division protein ZapA [Bdellovibrionota bacterium]